HVPMGAADQWSNPLPERSRTMYLRRVGLAFVSSIILGSCARRAVFEPTASVRVPNPEYAASALLVSEIPGARAVEHVFEIVNPSGVRRQVRLESLTCSCLGLYLPNEEEKVETGRVISLEPSEAKPLRLAFRVAGRPEVQTHSARFAVAGEGGG